jgi:hypothetical protein
MINRDGATFPFHKVCLKASECKGSSGEEPRPLTVDGLLYAQKLRVESPIGLQEV